MRSAGRFCDIIGIAPDGTLQIEGLSGEIRDRVQMFNQAGIVSYPTTTNQGYIHYSDGDTSLGCVVVHGNHNLVPAPKDKTTIIYDPDTATKLIEIDNEGIVITGDVRIKGKLTVEQQAVFQQSVDVEQDLLVEQNVTIRQNIDIIGNGTIGRGGAPLPIARITDADTNGDLLIL